MVKILRCPIDTSFNNSVLHKKWTLTILRDMMLGLDHFSDYLKSNPELSSKVLSDRLKDMEDDGLITRNIIANTPVEIAYKLTPKGFDLQKVLFELSMYGAKHYTEEVFGEPDFDYNSAVDTFGLGFHIQEEELNQYKKPTVSSQER